MIIMAVKMSSHCGVAIVFDVKDMTLESINDSVFSLSYIPNSLVALDLPI